MRTKQPSYAGHMSILSSLSVDASPPEQDLYSFNGTLTVADGKMTLDIKQFLHRGSVVKNSKYIDAMIIYTGVNTKISLNQG